MSSVARKSIALVIGSTRTPRVGPSICNYLDSVIRPKLGDSYTLTTVDVAKWDLPIFNEPVIPASLPADDPTAGYTKETTRAWSTEIRKYDAFIFVTPQYNWGVPAGLKNSIDYLFQEWKGKPSMVISYGGHGGDKAGPALLLTLKGVRMRTVALQPQITLGASQPSAMAEGKLLDSQTEQWAKDGVPEKVDAAFAELLKLLEEPALPTKSAH